jgi:hypothetical protein
MIHERYLGWAPSARFPRRGGRDYRVGVAPDEYNRVNATISRSARRLAARGLVRLNYGCLLPLEPAPRLKAELEAIESDIAKAGRVSDLYFHSNVCHADPVSYKGVLWYSSLCAVPTVRALR